MGLKYIIYRISIDANPMVVFSLPPLPLPIPPPFPGLPLKTFLASGPHAENLEKEAIKVWGKHGIQNRRCGDAS